MKRKISSSSGRVASVIAICCMPGLVSAQISAGEECELVRPEIETLPPFIDIPATVRDIHSNHADFQSVITGVETGLVSNDLGGDGLPVPLQAAGPAINRSPGSFSQWWNDTAGLSVTMGASDIVSGPLTNSTLRLFLDPGTGLYVFDAASEPNLGPTPDPEVVAAAAERSTVGDGGLWPLQDKYLSGVGQSKKLGGNYGNPALRELNFHMTMKLNTRFTYFGDEVFTFSGDDDVWVFVNNRLIMDLGGVHPRAGASVTLSDIALEANLVPGQSYNFDFFWAERHTTQSNFRLETNIVFGFAAQVIEFSGPEETEFANPFELDLELCDVDRGVFELEIVGIHVDENGVETMVTKVISVDPDNYIPGTNGRLIGVQDLNLEKEGEWEFFLTVKDKDGDGNPLPDIVEGPLVIDIVIPEAPQTLKARTIPVLDIDQMWFSQSDVTEQPIMMRKYNRNDPAFDDGGSAGDFEFQEGA